MNLPTLVDTLVSHLDTQLSVPISTKGAEETDECPAIILDGIEMNDLSFHNTELAQTVEHGDQSDERYYHYNYEARLRWIARHNASREAAELHSQLRLALQDVVEEPRSFHEEFNRVTLAGSGGQMSYDFIENTEAEMGQTMLARSYDQRKRANYDSIETLRTEIQPTD